MYVLGDVPLILQGAGSREKLSAAQSARVQGMRGGAAPVTPARVGLGVPSVLLYAAIGLAVAGFLRSNGGKNW